MSLFDYHNVEMKTILEWGTLKNYFTTRRYVEEYLKAIYDIAGKDGAARTTAIAKCLNISLPSVTEAMQKMAEQGLVVYEPYKGVTLTKEGVAIATKIRLTLKRVRWNTPSQTRPKLPYATCLMRQLSARMVVP